MPKAAPYPFLRSLTHVIAAALLLASALPVSAIGAGKRIAGPQPAVVLLHGLARSSTSMDKMAAALAGAGYRVCNIDYASRKHRIAELATGFVLPAIRRCLPGHTDSVHFVTHSLGGIIVRELSNARTDSSIGMVVMRGPPNQGSEVVDRLGSWRLFGAVNGPAGAQLSTDFQTGPRRLGPVRFPTGVIAGSRSINWINSMMIPGVDDGKVSLESARVEGMRSYVVVAASHPFLMHNDEAIAYTLRFLDRGTFEP